MSNKNIHTDDIMFGGIITICVACVSFITFLIRLFFYSKQTKFTEIYSLQEEQFLRKFFNKKQSK